MVDVRTEYLMVNKKIAIPIEFRFLKCKIQDSATNTEVETTKWMTSKYWRELMESIQDALQIHLSSEKFPETEPVLLSTEHLKFAYVFKLNKSQKQTIMNLQTMEDDNNSNNHPKETTAAAHLQHHNFMLMMSVSLVDVLNNTPNETFKDSLGCSQVVSLDSKQPSISSYFPSVT